MKKLITGILLLIFLLGFQAVFAASTGTCGENVKYTVSGNTIAFTRINSASAAEWGDCGGVFQYDQTIEIVKVNDTIRITSGFQLFEDFQYVKQMDLSKLDVSNVTDMGVMFYNCRSLISLDVCGWNTANVISTHDMFDGCGLLRTITIGKNSLKKNIFAAIYGYEIWYYKSIGADAENPLPIGTPMNKSDFENYNYNTMAGTWAVPQLSIHDSSETDISGNTITTVTANNQLRVVATPKVKNLKFVWCNNDEPLTCSNSSEIAEVNSSGMVSFKKAGTVAYTVFIAEDAYRYFYEADSNAPHVQVTITYTPAANTCGNNVKYVIDRHTINFSKANATKDAVWGYDCREIIKNDTHLTKVVIKDNIKLLSGLKAFMDCSNIQEMDVAKLDVSDAVRIDEIFRNCSSLKSLDLSKWNTSNVKSLYAVFLGCSSLTSINMSSWDTSNLTSLYCTFYNCSSLTNLDFSGWNTSNVTNMNKVFYGCNSLTSLNLSNWNTSNVTNMAYMFSGCKSLKNLYVSKWNTANVTDMNHMFLDCSSLESLDVSNWNTANVTDMNNMFHSCSSLTKLNLSKWNTAKVTSMSEMFIFCGSLTDIMVSNWNIANVTDIGGMFWGCSSLTSLDVSKWNTANVNHINRMFCGCSSLTSLNVSKWNTANVTLMGETFSGCSSLTSLDMSGWNTAKVTEMGWMFDGCSSLTGLNVSKWNTYNVTSMYSMFRDCSSLTNLDLSGWDLYNTTDFSNIFYGCGSLNTLTLGKYTLDKNIFTSLPKYNDTWYYHSASTDANKPLPVGSTKKDGALFTSYNYNTMAGTWSVNKPPATAVTIQNASGTNITGKAITIDTTDYQLKAAAAPKQAEQKFTWKSSAADIAAVSSAGKVSFKKVGTVTITTTAADGSKKYANVKLTYKPKYSDPVMLFVNRCYENIMGRQGDQGGLTYYTDLLKAKKLTGAQMVMNFINSPEFQGKKYSNEKVVELLYLTMMDRAAEANGLAYWAKFLNDGMSQKYIVRGFAGSAEFKNLCSKYGINAGTLTLTENRDKNVKVTQFVSRNYSIALGRNGDANGLNYWTGMILDKKLTPQQVADSFVFSKECLDKDLNNTDFVKMLYNLYMDRNADQSGLNYWLQRLKSDMSRKMVAASFGASNEFKQIVASYGL